MNKSELHKEMEAREAQEAEWAREYERVVRKMGALADELELMGESDMGIFRERIAARFHTVTRKLRNLVTDLQQDVYWPHEPGVSL